MTLSTIRPRAEVALHDSRITIEFFNDQEQLRFVYIKNTQHAYEVSVQFVANWV